MKQEFALGAYDKLQAVVIDHGDDTIKSTPARLLGQQRRFHRRLCDRC